MNRRTGEGGERRGATTKGRDEGGVVGKGMMLIKVDTATQRGIQFGLILFGVIIALRRALPMQIVSKDIGNGNLSVCPLRAQLLSSEVPVSCCASIRRRQQFPYKSGKLIPPTSAC
jgi:hypothetical protein